jgi:hypothetical protein
MGVLVGENMSGRLSGLLSTWRWLVVYFPVQLAVWQKARWPGMGMIGDSAGLFQNDQNFILK